MIKTMQRQHAPMWLPSSGIFIFCRISSQLYKQWHSISKYFQNYQLRTSFIQISHVIGSEMLYIYCQEMDPKIVSKLFIRNTFSVTLVTVHWQLLVLHLSCSAGSHTLWKARHIEKTL